MHPIRTTALAAALAAIVPAFQTSADEPRPGRTGEVLRDVLVDHAPAVHHGRRGGVPRQRDVDAGAVIVIDRDGVRVGGGVVIGRPDTTPRRRRPVVHREPDICRGGHDSHRCDTSRCDPRDDYPRYRRSRGTGVFHGYLDRYDPRLRDGSSYDSYTLHAVRGQTYQIQLESHRFDTYLMVVDDRDQTLASDDDGGPQLNSCLTWTASWDGPVRVLANSYHADVAGPYTLSIREQRDRHWD
jgi:hypothetical protein